MRKTVVFAGMVGKYVQDPSYKKWCITQQQKVIHKKRCSLFKLRFIKTEGRLDGLFLSPDLTSVSPGYFVDLNVDKR